MPDLNKYRSSTSANQDGTLSGGFVSVTGGRFRIVIGQGIAEQGKTNDSCTNRDDCTGDNNTWKCSNLMKCLVVPTGGNVSRSSTR